MEPGLCHRGWRCPFLGTLGRDFAFSDIAFNSAASGSQQGGLLGLWAVLSPMLLPAWPSTWRWAPCGPTGTASTSGGGFPFAALDTRLSGAYSASAVFWCLRVGPRARCLGAGAGHAASPHASPTLAAECHSGQRKATLSRPRLPWQWLSSGSAPPS